jgi:3-methylcrotonyl-CoA carboxylase alpha subunit
MNTRLQVEHGVTELVTGLDIVALQLAIAAGEPLPFGQDGVSFNGHALECRVYAEDPLKGYLPSPGRIAKLHLPEGHGVRNDIGTYEGDEISTFYDPLIGKLLTWGTDRQDAVRRMERALFDYRVEGVHTNLQMLTAISGHPVFKAGEATTEFLDLELSPEALGVSVSEDVLITAAGALAIGAGASDDPWIAAGPVRSSGLLEVTVRHDGTAHHLEAQRESSADNQWTVRVDGRERLVQFAAARDGHVLCETEERAWPAKVRRTDSGIEVVMPSGQSHRLEWAAGERHAAVSHKHKPGGLTAPMPGLVLKVLVRPGDVVRAHQTLIVLEAMKMEHNIEAPFDGRVQSVNCAEGGRVAEGIVLIELEQVASK